ncbi:MAG: hypothetical protein KF764_35425 [Labilithrix sp.]|nr:hypothetical protein [Labilithrix sp.]
MTTTSTPLGRRAGSLPLWSRAPRAAALAAGAVALAAAGCGSDEPSTPATSSAPLSEHYRRLGDNLGQTLALLKSSATAPGPITPADLGGVARVPKNLTGGVDIAVEQSGKSGEKAANIDGTGADETVSVFVPDAPTGGGTAASLPSFAAWKGDAESGDVGLCYLAWTKGASWFVASKCGDTTGAWVCQVTSSEAVCNACNTAGECAPCDLEASSFACAWP